MLRRITSSGFAPVRTTPVAVGEIHYIRNDKMYIVESIDGDTVTLRFFDWSAFAWSSRRMELWVALDLFANGDDEARENAKRAEARGYAVSEDSLPGFNVGDIDAYCHWMARGNVCVKFKGEGDGWRLAESFGSVGGIITDEGEILSVSCTRKAACELSEHPDFDVVRGFRAGERR